MPESALRVDDPAQAQRAGHQQRTNHRQAEGKLITDHLRRRSQPAEQRVLAVRGPSGERDAVHAEGCDGEDKEQADVDVGYLKLNPMAVKCEAIAKRNNRDGEKRQDKPQQRRHPINNLIGFERHDVFFKNKLQTVGSGLQQSVRTH